MDYDLLIDKIVQESYNEGYNAALEDLGIAEEATSIEAWKKLFSEEVDEANQMIKAANKDVKNGNYNDAIKKVTTAKESLKSIRSSIQRMEDDWLDTIISDTALCGLIAVIIVLLGSINPAAYAPAMMAFIIAGSQVQNDTSNFKYNAIKKGASFKENYQNARKTIYANLKRSMSKSVVVYSINQSIKVCDKIISECKKKSK